MWPCASLGCESHEVVRGGYWFEVVCLKEVVDNGGASVPIYRRGGGGGGIGAVNAMLRSHLSDSHRSEK